MLVGVFLFRSDPIFGSKLIMRAWLNWVVLAHSLSGVRSEECFRLAANNLYIDVGLNLCNHGRVRPQPIFQERPLELVVFLRPDARAILTTLSKRSSTLLLQ